ncbi:unnamed protein product [Brugia timori]|uniref:Uncharacterized protein n=1 Tax=Brugia timori TaxID=42155 RepID=A0A0R3R8W4_9BILA|nr:unnamed protein product [Brugia timori]
MGKYLHFSTCLFINFFYTYIKCAFFFFLFPSLFLFISSPFSLSHSYFHSFFL